MGIIELKDYEFVRVKGPETLQFLQGQVTCDTEKINTEASLVGAICNLKGQVVSDFNLILDGDDCLLRTQLGMAEIIIETLNKYAIFSKVELILETNFSRVIGFLGQEGKNYLSKIVGSLPRNTSDRKNFSKTIVIRLPGEVERFEVWVHKEEAQYWKSIKEENEFNNTWNREDLLQGIFHITPKNTQEYTPQLLNYDITGVIDFSKGCYTGQEIIARMHYRGKAKKRLFLLSTNNVITEDSEVNYANAEENHKAKILAYANKSKNSRSLSLFFAILETKIVNTNIKLELSDQQDSILKVESLPYEL